MQQRLLNRSLANVAHDLQIELLDLLPFLKSTSWLLASFCRNTLRILHTALDVENQFREFVLLHGVRSRGQSMVESLRTPCVWPPSAFSARPKSAFAPRQTSFGARALRHPF